MKHLKLASQKPESANIDLNGLFNAKVESKENLINGKAQIF